MVARKRLEVDLRDGSGRIVKFDVPMNATPAQITTLATRAIKQAHPDLALKRPVLDKPVYGQSKIFDASVSATPNSLRNRAGNKARDIATGVGFSQQTANNIASRTEKAIDFVPLAGDAVGADDAATAFKEGRYGEAALGAGATAVGLIPGLGDAAAPALKAMFLGAKAKTADKAALGIAEQMLAAGASRDDVWKATGWGKGADGNWRFEVSDEGLTVDENVIDDKYRMNQKWGATFDEAASHPALREAYPQASSEITFQREVGNRGLLGSWNGETGVVTLDTDMGKGRQRSTAAHELQHFVQGQEGFARGGMTGTVPAYEVDPSLAPLMSEYEDVAEELALRMDQFPDAPETMRVRLKHDDLKQRIDALKPAAEFEGYKRLAGEVEARNVQKRLDWSPEMRRAVPPWKTQEYPDEDQFKIWGGQPSALDPRRR